MTTQEWYKELAITPEEWKKATALIQAETWFRGWTQCPFGGWTLVIGKTVQNMRAGKEEAYMPLAITD